MTGLNIPCHLLWLAVIFRVAMGGDSVSQPATPATKAAHATVSQELPWQNDQDFVDARRGLIASLPPQPILDDEGHEVWNPAEFDFLKGPPPDTVNPSLWRQAQLNAIRGLFKVCDRIYQVRGCDLANVSFVEGDTGWIVIDPLTTAATARAAWQLVQTHLTRKPVVAVIYTHAHVDHFGGVTGIVSKSEVDAGAIRIIAPCGFMEHATRENIFAGHAMSRRASYMYGNLLPRSPTGLVDSGLGKTTAKGPIGLLPPTDEICQTGQELTVDGVRIVFQNTPDAESPAEMTFYFPQFRALCIAENATATLHNLYSLRGATVRDALAWSRYLDEARRMFGDRTDVIFAGHHWPRWGRQRVIDFLSKQRDAYKYLHDQTLRLANQGYTALEIAEVIQLPQSLASEFYLRGYYGTVSHNVKAVYQKYLGWFDGNPANLQPLPPSDAARKYVEFMGGAEAVLTNARRSFAAGEYRWVAQVVNHVVFADPQNMDARNLQADALEQLGYQAESAAWRNFYLTAAKELRQGIVRRRTPRDVSPDFLRSMSSDTFFDYVAIQLNGDKAAGRKYAFNYRFTDTGENYLVTIENSVLNYTKNAQSDEVDATVYLNRATLDRIMARKTTMLRELLAGRITIEGRRVALIEFNRMLDDFDFWFHIVEP